MKAILAVTGVRPADVLFVGDGWTDFKTCRVRQAVATPTNGLQGLGELLVCLWHVAMAMGARRVCLRGFAQRSLLLLFSLRSYNGSRMDNNERFQIFHRLVVTASMTSDLPLLYPVVVVLFPGTYTCT